VEASEQCPLENKGGVDIKNTDKANYNLFNIGLTVLHVLVLILSMIQHPIKTKEINRTLP
jgi:hypothetical protein